MKKGQYTFKTIDRSSVTPTLKAATACTFHWLSPRSKVLALALGSLVFSNEIGKVPGFWLYKAMTSFEL